MKREEYLGHVDRLISDCSTSTVDRPVSVEELAALRQIRAAFDQMFPHLQHLADKDPECRHTVELVESGAPRYRECLGCRWRISEFEYRQLRFTDMLCPRCRKFRTNQFTCVH